jgi:hypothetical protein
MWKPLTDEDLVEAYKREFIGGKAPRALVRLLEKLNQEKYRGLYAVTSLCKLRFTTVRVDDKHAYVAVLERDDEFAVVYASKGAKFASATRICKYAELFDVVELYLMRLVMEGQEGEEA